MSQTPAETLDRITDYVGGELSPEDMAATERWIAEDAERRALVEYLRQSREAVQRLHLHELGGLETSATEVIRGVHARIEQRTGVATKVHSQSTPPAHRSARRGYWAMSVGLLGLAAIALVMGVFAFHRTTPEASPVNAGARYVTTIGQKAAVTLADGSRITLAPQTTLTVAQGFGTTSRVVFLDGEAVFEVSGDVRHAFVVHTTATTTKVLGTTFAMRRYPEDHAVRVAVTDGKVVVSAETAQRPSVILAAGMVGEVTDSTARTVRTTDATRYSSWVNGRLEFDDVPVSEVLAALHRWYGYQFRVNDSTLAEQRLTIGISTESAQAALATLKMVWKVELVHQGNTITVFPLRRPLDSERPRQERVPSFSTQRSEIGK